MVYNVNNIFFSSPKTKSHKNVSFRSNCNIFPHLDAWHTEPANCIFHI